MSQLRVQEHPPGGPQWLVMRRAQQRSLLIGTPIDNLWLSG